MNVGTRHDEASVWISMLSISSPSAIASVSISRISSSGVLPRDQYERISTFARPARSFSWRASVIAVWRTGGAELPVALHVERARESR